MKEIWRDYVVRKYVRARTAEEAMRLAEGEPVIEVNEMQEKPDGSNSSAGVNACGFYMTRQA